MNTLTDVDQNSSAYRINVNIEKNKLIEKANSKKGRATNAARSSSLSLLALALSACMDNGNSTKNSSSNQNNSDSSDASDTITPLISGSLIKGPVQGARVFIDLNKNSVWDEGEPYAFTNAKGEYSLEYSSSEEQSIVADMGGALDQSSGQTFSDGVLLSSTTHAKIISPFTTLISNSDGMSTQDFAKTLGLPEDFDPFNDNPFATDQTNGNGLDIEKIAHKVFLFTETTSAILEGTGIPAEEAFQQSINALAQMLQEKNGVELEFNSSTFVQLLDTANEKGTEIDEALINSIGNVLEEVIVSINGLIEMPSSGTTPEFAMASRLSQQIKEVMEDPNKVFTFDVANEIDLINANTPPEIKIKLIIENGQIVVAENTGSLVVAAISNLDPDQQLTVMLRGPDAEFFEWDAITGELVFKQQPDTLIKSHYEVTILVNDGITTTAKTLSIQITAVEPKLVVTAYPERLDSLVDTIEQDLDSLFINLEHFFTNSQGTGLADTLDKLSSFDEDNISVNSKGITLIGNSDQKAIFSFANFSPTSIDELDKILDQFYDSDDFRELKISGGFESLIITSAKGQEIVHLNYTGSGFLLINPLLTDSGAAVDRISFDGNFGNEISDYFALLASIDDLIDTNEKSTFDQIVDTIEEKFDLQSISAGNKKTDIFKISLNNPSELSITVAGSEANHVINFSVFAPDDIVDNFWEAVGGITGFIELYDAGFGVQKSISGVDDGNQWNYFYQNYSGITEHESLYFYSSGTYFEKSIYSIIGEIDKDTNSDTDVDEALSLINDLIGRSSDVNFKYYTLNDSIIDETEYDALLKQLSSLGKFLETYSDKLSFNLSYDYGDETLFELAATDFSYLTSILYNEPAPGDQIYLDAGNNTIIRDVDKSYYVKLLETSKEELLAENTDDDLIAWLQEFFEISPLSGISSNNSSESDTMTHFLTSLTPEATILSEPALI